MAESESQEQALLNVCTDFFVLGQQIAVGTVELPSCEALKRRVLLLFEQMKKNAHDAGVVPSDVEDASYALAAYLDEMIQYSNWPGKQQWAAAPLQAALFSETKAGKHFFNRLEDVRRRSPTALRVYYTALCLGFMGELRVGGQAELTQLIDDLRRELFSRSPKALSIHGKRPDDGALGGRHLPLLPLGLACLVLAVAVVVVLYLVLDTASSDAVELLTKMGRG